MNVCPKFHNNPSNSCLEISILNKNVNLMVVSDVKSGDHQSQ